MRIIDGHARACGLDIRNQTHNERLLADLTAQIEQNRENDSLIHGLRVERMFAYVACALGACRAVKEEDAGELYAVDTAMRVPDFRILTVEKRELLVEVKNCHMIDLERGYRLAPAYLGGLKSYASAFRTELFIAIYWSKPKLWTLLSPNDFELQDGEYVVRLQEAMPRNNMQLLGDTMIGLPPSLTVRLLSDPTKPRAVDSTGQAKFTIGQVELYCGDQLIEDDLEKRIAWFLMNYGSWPGHKLEPEVDGGEVISIGFRAEPEERSNPDENFEIIGCLSEMISREFNDDTAWDGLVRLLAPKREPDTFGVVIPADYRGKALPLWRFNLQPFSPGAS